MRIQSWRAIALVLMIHCGVSFPATATTKRPVLNQPSQVLEQYFGKYWSRKTDRLPGGITQVTYTYPVQPLRRLFPETPDLKFSVVFVNNRAREVAIVSPNARLTQYADRMDQFFAYVFGAPPSKTTPVYKKDLTDPAEMSGSLQAKTLCLENGIATSYEWHSVPEATLYGKFVVDDRCLFPVK